MEMQQLDGQRVKISAGTITVIEVFSVCRADDAEALRLYSRYKMAAVNAVSMAIHDRHTGAAHADMTDAAFNDYLRGIMDKYGEQYSAEAGRRAEQEASA